MIRALDGRVEVASWGNLLEQDTCVYGVYLHHNQHLEAGANPQKEMNAIGGYVNNSLGTEGS